MKDILANESSLFQYLANECVPLMACLTPATGVASYEVVDNSEIQKFYLHGLEHNHQSDYMSIFNKEDPLHPRNFQHSHAVGEVLSLTDQLSPEDLSSCSLYNEHMLPYGYFEMIDFHFRKEGDIVAGITLFFDKNHSSYYNIGFEKLTALHHFMESTIGSIIRLNKTDKFELFCAQNLLTKKEERVLSLVLRGMANQDIADSLCCSLSTIKTHLQSVFNKLVVNSKAEAMALFFNVEY